MCAFGLLLNPSVCLLDPLETGPLEGVVVAAADGAAGVGAWGGVTALIPAGNETSIDTVAVTNRESFFDRVLEMGDKGFPNGHPQCLSASSYQSSSQKSEEKRGGSGPHNWGNAKEEIR